LNPKGVTVDSEASAIAKKLTNYFEISNHPERRNRLREVTVAKQEPGFFAHFALIALMGLAVFFTEVSLRMVQWAKKLEGHS